MISAVAWSKNIAKSPTVTCNENSKITLRRTRRNCSYSRLCATTYACLGGSLESHYTWIKPLNSTWLSCELHDVLVETESQEIAKSILKIAVLHARILWELHVFIQQISISFTFEIRGVPDQRSTPFSQPAFASEGGLQANCKYRKSSIE